MKNRLRRMLGQTKKCRKGHETGTREDPRIINDREDLVRYFCTLCGDKWIEIDDVRVTNET